MTNMKYELFTNDNCSYCSGDNNQDADTNSQQLNVRCKLTGSITYKWFHPLSLSLGGRLSGTLAWAWGAPTARGGGNLGFANPAEIYGLNFG